MLIHIKYVKDLVNFGPSKEPKVTFLPFKS